MPDINEIYFLNIDDLNSISTTFIGDCEYINGIDYDEFNPETDKCMAKNFNIITVSMDKKENKSKA